MSDVREGLRERLRDGRRAGLVGRGRSDREPDRGTVDDVAEDDGQAEDVRDDETTRAGDADAGEHAPPAPRDGDDPRTGSGDGPREDGTAVVEELLSRLAAAERARDEAVHRADALAADLQEARARPPETFGMRADKVLRMADHEAAQRRQAAERDAEELREQARAEASRLTADARAEAERITAAAATEVDRLSNAGADARRDGELVADTAASMHAHVTGLRSTVRDEVARLHALLGTELNRLDGPARMLSGRSRGGDTGPIPAVGPAPRAGADPTARPAGYRPASPDGAHALRGAGAGPDTGDLPAVSLPEQRAGGAAPGSGDERGDDRGDGEGGGRGDGDGGGDGGGDFGGDGDRGGEGGEGLGGDGDRGEDGGGTAGGHDPVSAQRPGAEPARTTGHPGDG